MSSESNNQQIELLKVTGYITNPPSSENKSTSDGEINLLKALKDMFIAIGRGIAVIGKGIGIFFVWLKDAFIWSLRFVKKNFWFFSVLIVIGAGAGFSKAHYAKPFYVSEMLVQTSIVPRLQVVDRINSLNELAEFESFTELSNQLKLNIDEIDDIFRIRATIIESTLTRIDKQVITDKDGNQQVVEEEVEEEGPQNVRIQLQLWDNQHIAKLNRAFVALMEEDAYTQDQWNAFKQHNSNQRNVLREEILRLREFQQKNITKDDASTIIPGNNPVVVERDERTYVTDILALQNQILDLERDSVLTKPLHVLQPFYTTEIPVDIRFRDSVIYALLFFAVGFLTLVGYGAWRKL